MQREREWEPRVGNGKSTTHIMFSFEKHIKEKNTLTGSEVSKLHTIQYLFPF